MKNPDLRIEYRVHRIEYRIPLSVSRWRFAADTEKECETWIEEHCGPGLLEEVTYTIQKVYTTQKKEIL